MAILRIRYKEAAGEAAWGRRATINEAQLNLVIHEIISEAEFAKGETVVRKAQALEPAAPEAPAAPVPAANEAPVQPAAPEAEAPLPAPRINILLLSPAEAAKVVASSRDLLELKAYAKLEGGNPKAPGGREKVLAAIQKRREALKPGKE